MKKSYLVWVLGVIFLSSVTLTSCGSHCSKTKRYWKNHRCVETNQTLKYFNKKIKKTKVQLG